MNREDERQVKAKEIIELKIRLKEVENASPTSGALASHSAVLTSPQRWMGGQSLQRSNFPRRGTRTGFPFAANGSKRELERRSVWDGP
ncbi:unnamed protein product [Ixodes pacificus]